MNRIILFAAIILLALPINGNAQTPDKEELDQFLNRLAEKNMAMGSMTIAKDGRVIYSKAIGYSQINGTEKKPITENSRFRIASIGKTYTAVMIMQLVEEQKLDLNETLDKFFPQIPNASGITITQLLQHRSGIPDISRDLDPQRDWANGITKDEMLGLIAGATPVFEPDTRQSYSNSGYFLLSLILEKLTDKPYSEILEERITSRSGLADTYVESGFIDVNKNESLSYIHINEEWRLAKETHPSIAYGAGQIMSTPNDMVRFIQALFDGKLVSEESLNQMKTIRDGEGFGLVTFDFAGKTFYGHTGGGDNHGSWLAYQPEDKLAVAYTTNAKIYPVVKIVSGAIDIYYGREFQIPTFEAVAVSHEVLDTYVGIYSNPDAPVEFTITRKDSKLFVQAGNESPAMIEATAHDRFQMFGGSVIFEFNPSKKQMIIRRSGGERVFTRED
jgi:CubicO group peptidase (beta-lactamase class C family)